MTEKCCIHYDSVKEAKLITLSQTDKSSWETLLSAARIRNHENIIRIGRSLTDGEIPKLKYHKVCRSMFVLKRNLNKIQSESEQTDAPSDNHATDSRSKRSSTNIQTSCGILSKECIFCKKESKYLRGTNTREKLYSCAEIRADESVRKASLSRGDSRVIAICSDELIAKEAMYHKSCYRNYTRCNYSRATTDEIITQNNEEVTMHDKAYNAVNQTLFNLIDNPKVLEYSKLTEILETELRKLQNIEERSIIAAKKNLRRRIENNFNAITFTTFDRKLYLYPDSFKDIMITEYLEMKRELDSFQRLNEKEKTISRAASLIREEIQKMEDKMPWPPTLTDLDSSRIDIGVRLKLFLHNALSGNTRMSTKSRVCRLVYSIGQDIVYAISNGKIKTPKSILFPSVIKSLTNCTELITISNKLGHGVSDSILEELFTENAFNVTDVQAVDVFIPTGIEKDCYCCS